MKFKLNPLILGERHDDLCHRRWLIDNLEKLMQMGYTCFAFEADYDLSLDQVIENNKESLAMIRTTYQNPQFVEERIQSIKRTSLEKLLSPELKEQLINLSTDDLLRHIDKLHPESNFPVQIAEHEKESREGYKRLAQLDKEKALLIELLLKVKSLGMKYMGVDANIGDKRRTAKHLIFNHDTQYDNKIRNPEITKRLAIGSKIHDGGIIGLIGLNHFADVARLLPGLFTTSPILKNYQALVQFRFVRIYDPSFTYNQEVEDSISSNIKAAKKDLDWFCFSQFNTVDASAIISFIQVAVAKTTLSPS